MDVVGRERSLEERVVGAVVGTAVDPLVEGDQLPLVAQRRVELGQQRVDRDEVGVGSSLGREARALGLEDAANLGEAREVARVDAGDEDAAAREDLDETVVLQHPEGVADRRPPEIDALDQVTLVDRAAGPQLERDDQLADAKVRLVGERLVGGLVRLEDRSHESNISNVFHLGGSLAGSGATSLREGRT